MGIYQVGAFLVESASLLLSKDFQIFHGGRGGEMGGCSGDVLYEKINKRKSSIANLGISGTFNGIFLNFIPKELELE